tara:strand:+ start:609 stop:1247 length:639 start_codon:yes stop_codon:yes gene_type:complete
LHKIKDFIISPHITKLNRFNPKLRIAVLASGKGSNFQNLVNLSRDGILDIEIIKLITNKSNAGCINKAISSKIRYEVINDKDFKTSEEFEYQIINALSNNQIELIVLAGWMKILSERFINSFKNRIINIHPSLLPSFKGNKAIERAFINKSLITGCSVHFVVPEVDSGELIVQGALAIKSDENIEDLKAKMHSLEHIILPQGISEAGLIIRS